MKRTSVTLAALLLAAPLAFAQSTTTPPADRPAAAPAGDMKFYSRQATDMRATNLIGANVTNMANENVGEINDLVLDKDGKVAAVVVGVGGFLGIGEREVALDYKSLNIKYDPNAMTSAGATTIQVNATKDTLKNAPAWTWNTDKNSGGSSRPPVAK
jgi:sporulation protein YlmC with PRC-barrel domain